MDQIVSTLMGGDGGLGGSESHNIRVVQQVFNTKNYQVLDGLTQAITDPNKPKAYLNYALFDENMNLVKEMSGAFQASGDGDWAEIGTATALEVPTNGYMAVYLSNTSVNLSCTPCSDVYFDQMIVNISHGNLLEENHYYPHGLPIFGLTSQVSDADYRINRKKYQGNEYITDLSLNWMSFGARQYDPQIGRFLGVDPLADQGGQDSYSPYAAMGNQPESAVDPNGLQGPVRDLAPHNIEKNNGSGPEGQGGGLATDLNWLMTGNNDGSDGSHPNFSANFSSMGINGVAINLFWNTFSASLKSMILADYNSYEVRQDSKRADNQHTYEMGELLYSLAGWKGGITGNMKKGFIFSPLEIKEGSYKWDNSGGNSGDNEGDNKGDFDDRTHSMLSTTLPYVFANPSNVYRAYTTIGRLYNQLGKANTSLSDLAYLASLSRNLKVARIGESASVPLFVSATLLDVTAYSQGQITLTKLGVNFGFGVLGFTKIGAPISAVYFSVDAFAPNGWEGGGEVPDPPAGYENVNIANFGN